MARLVVLDPLDVNMTSEKFNYIYSITKCHNIDIITFMLPQKRPIFQDTNHNNMTLVAGLTTLITVHNSCFCCSTLVERFLMPNQFPIGFYNHVQAVCTLFGCLKGTFDNRLVMSFKLNSSFDRLFGKWLEILITKPQARIRFLVAFSIFVKDILIFGV